MLSEARSANSVNHCSGKLWVFESDQGQRTQQRSVVVYGGCLNTTPDWTAKNTF